MHLNKSPWRRAVRASISLAAVLGMVGPLCADPVINRGDAQPLTGTISTTPWSADVETPAWDVNDFNDREHQATHSQSAPQDPIGQRPWRPLYRGRSGSEPPDRSLVQHGIQVMESSASSAILASASEDAQWRAELATALEVVRPAYEALAGSGMLDAIRSLESELGLNTSQSFPNTPSRYDSQGADHGAQPESIAWVGPGDRSDPFNRPRSHAEIAEEQWHAAIRMKELIEEAKLWGVTLVALYGLGYLVKLTLDYRHRKAARRRKRSVMSSRRRRRRRHRQHPMA